jgi:hypothetical protein
MNREDHARLSEPYESDGTDVSYRLARRIGVYVDEVIQLEEAIVADLDETVFGIGWWAPEPGTKRRILISDYLYQCCHSIQQNLSEAGIHLMEARAAWQVEESRIAKGLRSSRDAHPSYEPPAITAPSDELHAELFWMHVAGMMRAVGSVLDCIGGVAVGVGGLRTSILKADLPVVFERCAKLAGASAGERLQQQLARELRRTLESAGPPDWWRWATDYRNMLVHRGRRTRKSGGHLVHSAIVDAGGRPVARLRSAALLPRDPSRSDVEVMLHLGNADYLTEDGLVTLQGVLASIKSAATGAAICLHDVWRQRRAAPSLILQPREQWKDVQPSAAPFQGFAPDTSGLGFGQLFVSPVAIRRLRAAALTAELREKWKEFD